jgi:predicted MarR family transcription regulator
MSVALNNPTPVSCGMVNLTPFQARVLATLREAGKPVSWRDAAALLDWHTTGSVRTALEQLCRLNLVERTRNTGGGEHWWLYGVRG